MASKPTAKHPVFLKEKGTGNHALDSYAYGNWPHLFNVLADVREQAGKLLRGRAIPFWKAAKKPSCFAPPGFAFTTLRLQVVRFDHRFSN